MAKTGGPNFIDGFSSVQAVKRRKPKGKDPKTRPSRDTLPALDKKEEQDKKPAAKSGAKRISRSVIPEKFPITCYMCGYAFTLQGRVIDNFCPKCHEKLEAKDYSIEKEWDKDILTIGGVEVLKGAVLKECSITARVLSLADDASAAHLKVNNRLELLSGARFNVKDTVIHTLAVPKGASVTLKGTVKCGSLEVFGKIKANVTADKEVAIKKGASFAGSVEAPSLTVADGAALKAKLKIGAGRE